MDTVTGRQATQATPTTIPMPPFPGAVRYNPKLRSDTVKIWQNSLRARGYTDLKVDGFFGKYTNKCVVDWQTVRPQARNVDGICGLPMWRDLTTNPAPRASGPCSSELCPARGRPASSAADEIDPTALAAVADGYLLEGPIPEYLPDTEPDPNAEIEPDAEIEFASNIPMPPFPGAVRYNPKLRSDTVKIWQNSLRARGYTDLKVEGFFGKYTNKCVVDWQTVRPQARNVDGICGLPMWRDLTTNPAPRAWGPCSCELCPARGRPAGAAASDEEMDPAAFSAVADEYLVEGPIPEYLPDTEPDPNAELEVGAKS